MFSFLFLPLNGRLAAACPALLLAAVLAGCNQQSAAASDKAALAPAPAASPAASAAELPASAASDAAQPASAPASAIPPAFTTPQEEAVLKRAQERWDALVARDFERAWIYLDAAGREKVKQQDYAKMFGDDSRWTEAKAQRARCITGRCSAFIELTSMVLVPNFKSDFPEFTTHFDEEWVLEGEQWHYHGMADLLAEDEKGERLPSAADPLVPRPVPIGLGPAGRSQPAKAASQPASAASRPAA